ncbi:MAG: prepilin-type N-terminal cleavage/methylation domain-containing protein [Patescibacteria group bacterium]|nr:prepilin-type N-terminal cleavage/methylation domain-containing protein [Patescibacteria group bacterium]
MPKDNPKAFHKFIVFAANRLGLFSTPDTASSLTLRQALGKSYRRVQDKLSERDSFTLIELLIVIAIIGILAAVVVLVVNPAQLIAQGRDSTRVQDLSDINTALGEYLANGNTSLGLANTVYVSVPDASATCSDLGLPSLPAGWSYHCVPTSTLTEVNGSGWIPVNFASVTTGNPLPTLPIDPQNTTSTNEFYTYAANGTAYELTAYFESAKYQTYAASDGGPDPSTYEVGSNLALTPFLHGLIAYYPLSAVSGTILPDASGWNNNGTLEDATTTESVFGPETVTSGCQGSGGSCVYFDGAGDYVGLPNLLPNSGVCNVTIMGWGYNEGNGGSGGLIGGSSNGWDDIEYSDTSLRFELRNGSVGNSSGVSGNFLNNWQFVAQVLNNGNAYGYLNGQRLWNGGNIGCIGLNNWSQGIGKWDWYFHGIISKVRVYNTALSPTQIQAIYNAENPQ